MALGEVIELKRGYDLPSQVRRPGGVPVVSSSGVSDRHAEAMATAPGVVTGRYGTIGQVFYLTEDFWPLNTTLYVRDFKGNDPRFVSYLLRTVDFSAYSDKAAVPGVNRNHLHQARVHVPVERTEQSAISRILGVLDDKIELNRRMNETLEAIVRALFRSWFVDFDPVRAKIEGRDTGLPPEIASLFPDSLDDSDLGGIPSGWTVATVGDIAVQSRVTVDPGAFPGEIFDHFSIPAFDAGRQPAHDSGASIKSQKFMVTSDAVLISKLNPRIPRVWLPALREAHRGVASTEFLVISPRPPASREYLYFYASSDPFTRELLTLVGGTSGSHQRVSPDSVHAIRLACPPEGVVTAFTARAEPIVRRLLVLDDESRTLRELRDTLLSKLISGEIRVPDLKDVA